MAKLFVAVTGLEVRGPVVDVHVMELVAKGISQDRIVTIQQSALTVFLEDYEERKGNPAPVFISAKRGRQLHRRAQKAEGALIQNQRFINRFKSTRSYKIARAVLGAWWRIRG